MKCLQCDVLLTDFEATRLDTETGLYLDLCNDCFKPMQKYVKVKERYDLLSKKDRHDLDKATNEDK